MGSFIGCSRSFIYRVKKRISMNRGEYGFEGKAYLFFSVDG